MFVLGRVALKETQDLLITFINFPFFKLQSNDNFLIKVP
jgi:hypothetical protein